MANTDLYFFDISKNGKDYTGQKDIAILGNTNAVIESIHNILLTEPGDRPMKPEFGVNLSRFLFEPITEYVAVFIQEEIERALQRFEPRINNISVLVEPLYDQNSFDITISFNIAFAAESLTAKVRLNKIR